MRWMIVAAALLAAGCGEKVDSNIAVLLDTDLQKGTVTMTCRESSSGTCHALFAFRDDVIRLEAAQGSTATATNITEFSRYCVGPTAPGDGCELKKLTEGEQIIRKRSTHS